MQAYQEEFIKFCLKYEILRFGEFTLKSGRISPYFFNAGLFKTGVSLAGLGQFYAQAIMHATLEFDVLFGPAYKGIPLASATAIALADKHNREVGYAFNRKEVKDHGEGGLIVGHELAQKRIMIIDDVISAGTAVRQSMDILKAQRAIPAGVLIAMDRQERGQGQLAAIQEIEQTFEIPVISIIKLEHLLTYVAQESDNQVEFKHHLKALRRYQEQYSA